MLDLHPFKTKALSSTIIAGAGDLTCQYIVQTSEKKDGKKSFVVDWVRTARFASLGGVLVAPCIHYWYGWLMTAIPGITVKATVIRTLLDQLVFAPLFIPTFFTALMGLEGTTSLSVIKERLEGNFLETLKTNWMLWIPAQLINFGFMPAKYQVLFSNVVGLVWNTYLSFMSTQKKVEVDGSVEKVKDQ